MKTADHFRAVFANGELQAQAAHESEALLRVDRVYEAGDRIENESNEKHLIVQMDATILPGEVYLPERMQTCDASFAPPALIEWEVFGCDR